MPEWWLVLEVVAAARAVWEMRDDPESLASAVEALGEAIEAAEAAEGRADG